MVHLRSIHISIINTKIKIRLVTSLRDISGFKRLRMIYNMASATQKRSLMTWVSVIPKEGWALLSTPILLLEWHRLRSLGTFFRDTSHISMLVLMMETLVKADQTSSHLQKSDQGPFLYLRHCAQTLSPGKWNQLQTTWTHPTISVGIKHIEEVGQNLTCRGGVIDNIVCVRQRQRLTDRYCLLCHIK